jgi:uncharacterized protein (TIGR03435 family)
MPEGLKSAMMSLILAAGTFAQSPAAHPAFDEFEVATIKPAVDDQKGAFIRMQSAHRFYVKNYPLKAIVAAAYDLSPRAISGGPSWIESDTWDILAGTPGEAQPNPDEQMSMLRKLLNDRFKLAFHREWKEFSIYALKVAKSGSKLRESATLYGQPDLVSVVFPDGIWMPGRNATMAQFASKLQRGILDRPVVDNTRLNGKYDFDLRWSDDESQFGGQLRKRASADGRPDKPDLFAAVQQQLGLRLDATRGPVEVLVIDKVERPSEN